MATKNPVDNSNCFGPVMDEVAGRLRTTESKSAEFVSKNTRRLMWLAIWTGITAPEELTLPILNFCVWAWILLRLASLGISHIAASTKAKHAKELLDGSVRRRISLWNHTSAVIGGWEATLSSDAGTEGEFEHPLNLTAAIDAIERHIELFAPNFPGLSRLRFCASAEFFERWCAQAPEDIAALRAPIAPELDRGIRSMLDRVRQEAVSGQHVFDVEVWVGTARS